MSDFSCCLINTILKTMVAAIEYVNNFLLGVPKECINKIEVLVPIIKQK